MKKIIFFILLLCLALTISVYANPKRANGMLGIKLGDTVDQVKNVLGEPKPEDIDESTIAYRTQNNPIAIYIHIDEEQKVDMISVSDPSYGANIQGVSIGTDAQTVKKIFGKPEKTTVDKYNSQYYSWEYFKRYNLEFNFFNGKVNGIIVSTPQGL